MIDHIYLKRDQLDTSTWTIQPSSGKSASNRHLKPSTRRRRRKAPDPPRSVWNPCCTGNCSCPSCSGKRECNCRDSPDTHRYPNKFSSPRPTWIQLGTRNWQCHWPTCTSASNHHSEPNTCCPRGKPNDHRCPKPCFRGTSKPLSHHRRCSSANNRHCRWNSQSLPGKFCHRPPEVCSLLDKRTQHHHPCWRTSVSNHRCSKCIR